MDELIKVMSDEALLKLKSDNEGNESIGKLVEGILEGRVREVAQAKAMEGFTKGIDKIFAKLPHPDDIHNVYVRWGEVDVPDGEPGEVVMRGEVPYGKEVNELTEEDLTLIDEGTLKVVTNQPTKKEYHWIVQVNKSVVVASGASGNGSKASKRAITIYKREGLTLVAKGNYPSASKACEALGLAIGGDSATRVLARESYIIEPLTGNLDS